MIRVWMAGLGAHTLSCLVFASAAAAEAGGKAPLWIPDDMLQWTAVVFGLGPLLGFLAAGLGPRAPHRDIPTFEPRIAKRVVAVAVLVLGVPVGLLTAVLTDVAVGGTMAIGSAALLMILAPWMALYVRWFSEA